MPEAPSSRYLFDAIDGDVAEKMVSLSGPVPPAPLVAALLRFGGFPEPFFKGRTMGLAASPAGVAVCAAGSTAPADCGPCGPRRPRIIRSPCDIPCGQLLCASCSPLALVWLRRRARRGA